MQLTRKQREILQIIVNGNVNDEERYCDVDLDQVLERISYKTSKESLQFSIRSLIKKDMVEKGGTECRRGKSRQTYKPTELSLKIFKPGTPVSF
ncbi:hypothetical protein ABXV18_24900 [Vibrio owensii]|uniref:hypothetical protein n=1 Tax=Vibrio owensii TaxID=696485 RepID=UPI003395474F